MFVFCLLSFLNLPSLPVIFVGQARAGQEKCVNILDCTFPKRYLLYYWGVPTEKKTTLIHHPESCLKGEDISQGGRQCHITTSSGTCP
jgi:hypothetical protein